MPQIEQQNLNRRGARSAVKHVLTNLQNIVCNDFLDGLSFVVKPVFKFKTSSNLINYQQMAVNIAKETFFQNLIILVLS